MRYDRKPNRLPSPVRVLHVYRTYFPDPPGGLQEAIRQICGCSKGHGITHTIFTLSPKPHPGTLSLPEARVVRSRSWAAPRSCDLGDWRAVAQFAALSRESHVVHFHYPWPYADLMNLLSRSSRPVIVTYHSDVVRQRLFRTLFGPIMRRTLKQARAIVATSPQYLASSRLLSHPLIRGKVRVIPLGLDDYLGSLPTDLSIKQRLHLGADEPFFFFIGVLRYYKGLQYLVRAAKFVPAKIVIAGTGPEGSELKRLASALHSRNVVFAGLVTDAEKAALFRDCRAFVLPSHVRSEAFGMSLIEAASFARPLMSCDIGTGTSFINRHGETGLVVAPESPTSIADAINFFLENPGRAAEMGQAALRRYQAVFTGSAVGDAYAQLYREIAA